MDLAELSGDLAEGLGEPGLQGGVEFFVDGDAHLFELGGVVLVEFGETVFDGEAEFLLLGVASPESSLRRLCRASRASSWLRFTSAMK